VITFAVAAGPLVVVLQAPPFLIPALGGTLAAVGWLAAIYFLRHPLRLEVGRGLKASGGCQILARACWLMVHRI
jgi:hypothetical protein